MSHIARDVSVVSVLHSTRCLSGLTPVLAHHRTSSRTPTAACPLRRLSANISEQATESCTAYISPAHFAM
eukprot:612010-Rhodomonas_salina.1